MKSHLHELIEATSTVHYETFRTKQLLALKESTGTPKLQSLTPGSVGNSIGGSQLGNPIGSSISKQPVGNRGK